jgi:hypothetical protein
MHTLPHTPVTFTTRQLTCVSCQERFAIAEDLIMTNQSPAWNGQLNSEPETIRVGNGANDATARPTPGLSAKWRLPNDKTEAIALREQEVWMQRSVTPQKRAEPLHTPEYAYSYERTDDNFLNCPRCGADNRNWAQLRAQPASWRLWLNRFPLAGWGVIVALAIAVTTTYVILAWDLRLWHSGLLLLAILVAGTWPCLWLTGAWEKLRRASNLETVRPNSHFQTEMLLWSKGLLYVLLVALVIPLFLFEAGPRFFDYGLARLAAIESVTATIAETTAAPAEADTTDTESEPSEAATTVLPPYDTPHIYLLQQLLLRYPWLADLLVEAQPEVTPPPAEPAPPSGPFVSRLGIGLRYLTLWAATVGLAALFAVTVSLTAAGQFAARVNGQLPVPIFNSVAYMSRVVMWEAKRALKINGDLSQIQWMRVDRNNEGGIDLIGLHRDQTDLANDNFPSNTVRAQRYTIHSDIWGRIIYTEVRDVMVPRSIHQPQATTARQVVGWEPEDIDYEINQLFVRR